MSATDASGNATLYTYDRGNLLIREVDPLSNITSHAFDRAGNRTVITEDQAAVPGMYGFRKPAKPPSSNPRGSFRSRTLYSQRPRRPLPLQECARRQNMESIKPVAKKGDKICSVECQQYIRPSRCRKQDRAIFGDTEHGRPVTGPDIPNDPKTACDRLPFDCRMFGELAEIASHLGE